MTSITSSVTEPEAPVESPEAAVMVAASSGTITSITLLVSSGMAQPRFFVVAPITVSQRRSTVSEQQVLVQHPQAPGREQLLPALGAK
jgi:predicted alpha/beta hydrolase family esterase